MNIKKLIKDLTRPLFKEEIDIWIDKLAKCTSDLNYFRDSYEEVLEAEEQAKNVLDKYCEDKFKKIPNIAYEQKREIRGVYYSVSLNELITPKAYAVIKFMKGFQFCDNMLLNAKSLGTKVAQTLTWDSDNNLDKSGDYYLYPAESLARKKCDCEDHAFVEASCHPNIGVAYGYAKNIGWHAFNVFIHSFNLYVLDTVGDSSYTELFKDNGDYKINFIITRDNTYKVTAGTSFGKLAGW